MTSQQDTNIGTARSLPAVLGYGTVLATLMGVFDFAGGAMTGYKQDPDIDEFERKERLRKNYRRPIQETVAELGEGRGKGQSAALIQPIRKILTYVYDRHLWPWLCRAKSTEDQRELRH